VAAGGHNLLEPALRGKPVLFGPHTENFRESAALLGASGGGLLVRDGAELASALIRVFTDPDAGAALGASAARPRPRVTEPPDGRSSWSSAFCSRPRAS